MGSSAFGIKEAQEALRGARSVFVITGAGVSAESGVPTFRNPGGLWNQVDPTKVATPEAFAADPAFVWQWYDERRANLLSKKPNPAHETLARMERQIPRFFMLTQNVDDLHEQAGSIRLAHIHGEIWQVRCTTCNQVREERRAPLPHLPPRCPYCGGLERPNVVWFGEQINLKAIEQTEAFLAEDMIDVILVIGTEATFPYILHWATNTKVSQGTMIEINLAPTQLTPFADIHLRGKSGVILPEICAYKREIA